MFDHYILRDGVDEDAVRDLLTGSPPAVRVSSYWSSAQAAWGRALDRCDGLAMTFGIAACHGVLRPEPIS